jgi:uncharacterized protein YecT (DUF1311 family)
MEDERGTVEIKRRRINPWLIAGIIAAIAAGVLLASTIWTGRWSGDKNEVPENAVVAEKKPPNLEGWCASQATYDAMKRELFRRAAQVRGSDEQSYARLADFALLRVNGPIVRGIDDQLESASCSGTAVLELPPGVQVSGGRRSLSGDIDYMIQPAADGTGNVVRLGEADSIVVPLATLSRKPAQQAAVAAAPEAANAASDEQPGSDEQAAPEQGSPVQANPSFDCAKASRQSEVAICKDPGLAALDRQMAAQYNGALMQADRGQRKLLERTRDRFLSYRDRCDTNQCIAETYRSRMREIGDIMADRWRG